MTATASSLVQEALLDGCLPVGQLSLAFISEPAHLADQLEYIHYIYFSSCAP